VQQALSDISVIELGTGVAASWCGKGFADLGADVVKVEPPEGDPLRRDRGAFAHLNTNKRSVVVLRSVSSASELLELLFSADLLVETPGQGSLSEWGISREELLSEQPRSSIVTITGFGATGPYSRYKWSDLVVQTFTGSLVSDLYGPVKLPMSVAECTVGQTAAMAGLAAVLRSRSCGRGAIIDCAATEALATSPLRMSRHLGWEYGDREPLEQQIGDTGGTVLPLGLLPCADGYVAMMMTPQQLGEMLTVLDDDRLRSFFARPDAFTRPEAKEVVDGVVYPWLLERTRREITDTAQAAGWPVTMVHSPGELLKADHLHQRGFWVHAVDEELGPVLLPGAPYRFTEGGWSLRRTAPRLGQSDPPGGDAGAVGDSRGLSTRAAELAPSEPELPPLHGLRVLDMTTVWSGPLVTMHLADLGAEVIRLESPWLFPPTTKGYLPRPDPHMLVSAVVGRYGPRAPDQPDRPYNRHAMNNSVARGKRSCTLEVRDPEQRALFFNLVSESDVFVENLKSAALHKMGIHESELLEANPKMIVLRLPPAGLSGDWGNYSGFGGQFDALTGLAFLCGHRDTELMETPTTQHMDSATGSAAAFAVLAALHYRASTGRGQVIELAQSENVISQLGDVFVNLQAGIDPRRFGNRDPYRAPQGLYPCADDGFVAISVDTDESWHGLANVIGRADLEYDERLSDASGRMAAHDRLDEAIAAWASTVSAQNAFFALQEVGVAAAPYLDEAGFANDPQVVDRQWIQPLTSRDVGTFCYYGHAFTGLPLAWGRGSPALGEDNEYVFRKILGLNEAEYGRLLEQKIAVEDYLDPDGKPY
jgi:crotonobetainyl-CoA:carnitine CoA-transferase CaiB-like acyl-CoA transferase